MSAPAAASSSSTVPAPSAWSMEWAEDLFEEFRSVPSTAVRSLRGFSNERLAFALRAFSEDGRKELYPDGLATSDIQNLDVLHAHIIAEQARRATLLVPLSGGLPHFPLQPWEREMQAWMEAQDVAHQNPHMSFAQLVTLYETSKPARHPEIDISPERLHANAVMFAYGQVGEDYTAQEHFVAHARRGHGPGTALWHYTVERMHYRRLSSLRSYTSPDHHRNARGYTWEDRQVHRYILLDIYDGLVMEETRVQTAYTYRRRRSEFAQSGLVDHMMTINPHTGLIRGGRDPAQIVGQFHSPRITPRHVPGVRNAGPVRSNADVLREIARRAAEYAAAAAAANPKDAIASLQRVASELGELVDSVAKRARH